MAEYGLIIQSSKIKGDITLSDFKAGIPANNCSFSSSARRTSGTGRLSVEQSPVSIEIRAGKWMAELQQACYDVTSIGDVIIYQLAQAIDRNPTAAPTVIQKITLTNALVTSIQQGWDNGDGARGASISFSFDKILFEIGTKPADFTLRNITAPAV